MTGFLLTVHVIAAIIAIGPVAVTTSMFPPAFRSVMASPQGSRETGTVVALARVTRVYSVIAVVVPVFGVATAASLGVITDPWLIIAMTLTAVAALILIRLILPAQKSLLAELATETAADTVQAAAERSTRRLAMQVGIFNLLWAAVVTLMIYRPGSTTGVQ